MLFLCMIRKSIKIVQGFYFDPTTILPGKIVTDTDSLVTSVKRIVSKTEQEQRLYVQFFVNFALKIRMPLDS